MKRIDIVLPVYNEEECIAGFNSALFETLDSLTDYEFQVIYVVDPSRDNTLAVLRQVAEEYRGVTVIHLSRRFGHQMALIAGIDRSRGDAVIMMDCDLQHPPAVIPLLLEKFEKGYDIVQTIREYHPGTGALKLWTSKLFYRVQNALSPVQLNEGAADFRLISRKVAEVFRNSVREQNPFLRGLFQWIGFRSTTVSYMSAPRLAGVTKYRLRRLLALAATGILSFSKAPLRLVWVLGVFLCVLGVVFGAASAGAAFLGWNPLSLASVLVIVTILLVGGMQLALLGIIGEYVGSVLDEVRHRPLYVVDEVFCQNSTATGLDESRQRASLGSEPGMTR